jgi:hypothetical protein
VKNVTIKVRKFKENRNIKGSPAVMDLTKAKASGMSFLKENYCSNVYILHIG